jgi:predicted metal-binding membrane protein
VTDFAQPDALAHLPPAATRLSGALARPKRIAFTCIAVLTALGWASLALMSSGGASGLWQALCQPGGAGRLSDLALAAPMWAAMTLAMMLPTAGPMILTYAEIADTAARKGEPVVSPLVLTAGYVAVWLGFALAAAALQWALLRAGLMTGGGLGRAAGGAIFIAAGLYQFSALKQSCLTQCQRPFPFFFANWTEERTGVFRLGLRQGLYCLGCCWAAMLVMFAVGTMNVVWMAALGVLMTIEKLATTQRFSRAVGVAFVAIGLVMAGLSVG